MAAVDPYLGNIYQIPFGQSGMMAHENRWLAQPTELLVAENVTFDNDVLQKEAAFQFYDAIGVDQHQIAATASVSGTWSAAAVEYGGPVFTGLSTVVTGAAIGPANPWTVTTTAGAALGHNLMVSLALPGVPAGNAVTITDSRGNLYTQVAGGALHGSPLDGPVPTYLFTAKVTTALLVGDTITVAWVGPASDTFVIVEDVAAPAGPFTSPQQIAANTGTGTAITVPPGTDGFVYFTVYPSTYVASVFLNKDSATSTVTFTAPGAAFTVLTVTVNLAGHGQLFQRWMTAPASTSAAIVAQIDWNSQYDAGTIAGTVSITQGSNFVSGAGTVFTTALRVNDQVIINNEVQTVQSITSDTVLFTYDNWLQATVSGQTLRRGAGPVIITAVTQTVGAIPNSLAIYKEKNGVLAAVQLHQNPNGVPRGRFVVAGKESAGQSRKLFYFNGVNPVVFLQNDDATMTALTAYPPDWSSTVDPTKNPVNGTLHQGALFGWGNLSDPHRIYRSQTADHTKFTNVNPTDDAGQYPIASSIGERLWGGAEFQGVLFLWKYPRGIFYFDDTDPNFLNWTYHIRSEALGCAPSPHAVLPMDDDILFCAPDGHFHLLSAVANLGGVDTSDLTRMLGLHRWTREHLHIPSLGQMTSAYNTYSKIAYVGVRSRNATTPTNDLLLKFDFGLTKRGGPVRFSYTTALHPNALCTRRSASSGNPQSGTPLLLLGEQASAMLQVLDDGTVGTKLTHGFRNDAARGGQMQSTSYAIRAASPRLDFADADPMNRQRRKNYDAIEFIFGEADLSDLSGQTLVADIVVDGVSKQRILLQNLTQTRVLRQLRVGDGYDWQVVLSTAAVTSATLQTPPVVPDLVQLGLQVYWRPGSQDHGNTLG